jgi:6 kDa early secretory antigenic target
MTRFQVDSEAVSTATGAARSSIGRIGAEVIALHAQLTNLQSSWTGGAATAFQTAVADWNATQKRVEESLTGLNTALNSAGIQYADTEAQNTRLFAR